MEIYNDLLATDLVNDEYFDNDLLMYFPSTMREGFAQQIKSHQLRREIIAKQLTNLIANRVSTTMVSLMSQDLGHSISDLIRCIIIVIDSLRIREAWDEIESATGVSSKDQLAAFVKISEILETWTAWVIRHQRESSIAETVKKFQPVADQLREISIGSNSDFRVTKTSTHASDLSIVELKKTSALTFTSSAFDILRISSKTGVSTGIAAGVYLALDNIFSFGWIHEKIDELLSGNYWQKASARTLDEEFRSERARIASDVARLGSGNSEDAEECCDRLISLFLERNPDLLEKFNILLLRLRSEPVLELPMLITLLGRIRAI